MLKLSAEIPKKTQKPENSRMTTLIKKIASLNAWIIKHRRWPDPKSDYKRERSLANWVSSHGGRKKLLIHPTILTLEAKQVLIVLRYQNISQNRQQIRDRNQLLNQWVIEKGNFPSKSRYNYENRELALWVDQIGGQWFAYNFVLGETAKAALSPETVLNIQTINIILYMRQLKSRRALTKVRYIKDQLVLFLLTHPEFKSTEQPTPVREFLILFTMGSDYFSPNDPPCETILLKSAVRQVFR